LTDDIKTAYLNRAFERIQADALTATRKGRDQLLPQMAAKGLLMSGNMLHQLGQLFDTAAAEATAKMVQRTFDIMGDNSRDVVASLESGLREVRDALSNELAGFFRSPQGSWASKINVDYTGNTFLNSMDQRITATVDDFGFGILGGSKMTKDPLVSVVGSISNSPGAVLQSGFGSVQQVSVTVAKADAIRAAVSEFVASEDVRKLPPDDQQSIKDVAEVITGELDKPAPEVPKLQRWAKRLSDIAEKLGVAVAAGAIRDLLLG
jgi:hypothetical protein